MARVVAICGGSGSGKSTVAAALVSAVGAHVAQVLPLDAYYHDLAHLPAADREQVDFDHPDALDLGLFREHLLALKSGTAVWRPEYDFSSHCRLAEPVMVVPGSWIVAEGILVASDPVLRGLYDLLVFVEADSQLRWERRLGRDQAERGRNTASITRFWERAESAFQRFGANARQQADCVVSGAGAADAAAQRVLHYLRGVSPKGHL